MSKIDRRQFLKNSVLATAGNHMAHGLGLAWISGFANQVLAAQDSETNFVLIRIPGAMDNLLGLNPWSKSHTFSEQDLFLGYQPQDIKPLDGTQVTLGPAAQSIHKFAKDMAVIRGIIVGANDLGHPFAVQHMASGWEQESAPYWTAQMSAYRRKSEKFLVTNRVVPYGTIKPTPLLLTQTLKAENGFAANSSLKSLNLYKQQSNVIDNYRTLMADSSRTARFQAVLADYAANPKDEHFALAALYSGAASVVQIDIEEQSVLDTHLNHAEQHPISQKARWERVASFLDGLKKFGLFEKTLVVVTTEFNRTPGLNANGGKDHNYTDNSVALFGYGVNGGTAVGDHTLVPQSADFSDSFLVGQFIDYGSQAAPANPQRIFEGDTAALVAMAKEGKSLTLPGSVGLIRPRDVWATVVDILDTEMSSKLPRGSRPVPGIKKG